MNEIEKTETHWLKVGEFIVINFATKQVDIDSKEIKSQYRTSVVIDKKGLPHFVDDYAREQYEEKVNEFLEGEWEFDDEEEKSYYEEVIKDFIKNERCFMCGKLYPKELMTETEGTMLSDEGEITGKVLVCFDCQSNMESSEDS